MPGGRPRGFDVDAALDRALDVFWRQGYEGTSLTDLTAAMGVNRPSLYAAFGNKLQLFAAVLNRYESGPGAGAAVALAAPTARAVVERLLAAAIELSCGPDTPPGCLSVRNAQACGPEAEAARAEVLARRTAALEALTQRLEAARAAGDLPPDSDPGTLARYVTTVTDGIAVEAAAGASRGELEAAAAVALRAWPTA